MPARGPPTIRRIHSAPIKTPPWRCFGKWPEGGITFYPRFTQTPLLIRCTRAGIFSFSKWTSRFPTSRSRRAIRTECRSRPIQADGQAFSRGLSIGEASDQRCDCRLGLLSHQFERSRRDSPNPAVTMARQQIPLTALSFRVRFDAMSELPIGPILICCRGFLRLRDWITARRHRPSTSSGPASRESRPAGSYRCRRRRRPSIYRSWCARRSSSRQWPTETSAGRRVA